MNNWHTIEKIVVLNIEGARCLTINQKGNIFVGGKNGISKISKENSVKLLKDNYIRDLCFFRGKLLKLFENGI